MKSHRRMPSPEAQDLADLARDADDQIRKLRPAKWGTGFDLRRGNYHLVSDGMGQPRRFDDVRATSVVPPKAGIGLCE